MSIPATVNNMEKWEAFGPVAYSPYTDERFSATPGDYFQHNPDRPLTDYQNHEMILCVSRSYMIDIDELEDFDLHVKEFFNKKDDINV